MRLKKGSKAAKDFMAKLRAKRGKKSVSGTKKPSNRQTGTSNRAIDKRIEAKKPGRRIVGKGNNAHAYYERRANRSDKGRLMGMAGISLNDVGSELLELEFKINNLRAKKEQTRLVKDKKIIQEKIKTYSLQFKALRTYLNTRAKFK